jgi:spore maturation protein CgeB/GT2 family glycosyltransferase
MTHSDPTPAPTPPDRELAELRERVAAQERELEGLRRALASSMTRTHSLQRRLLARQRELEQLRSTITVAVAALRDQLERVAGSAAWRYGHAASRAALRARGRRALTAGGVVAALGQTDRVLEILGAPPAPADGMPDANIPAAGRLATRGDELLLGAHLRDRLGPPPPRDSWPSVSVVIVSRSARRARDLISHLEQTLYPSLHAVLVDNASPGGEVSHVTPVNAAGALTVSAVRLDDPVSFAAACNRGAERAAGGLLVFANDDVRPLDTGWLAELVSSHSDGAAGITGATLVDPRLGEVAAVDGLGLEQRGITLDIADGELRTVARERGEDVLGGRFGTDVPTVAVSAACLAIEAGAFARLGGFDTGYQYGLEDVDLCLRARAEGMAVVCSGRSLLVHQGSASQTEAGREFRRVNRAINHRRLRGLWAPELRRERLRGLLAGDPAWGDGPHLGIVRSSNDPAGGWGDHATAQQLGAAARALGWRVSFIGERDDPASPVPGDLDIALVLVDGWDLRALPAQTLACAWVRNWTERWLSRPWLDRCDVLLASSSRAVAALQEATGRTVELMPLAADPDRFTPRPPGVEPTLDWVLCAHRWGEPRAIEAALHDGLPGHGAIHGRGWGAAGLAGPAAEPLSRDELPAAYRDARVVLDDTAATTLEHDFVNARVFEALACGTLVITNGAAGVRELFDDDFPVWSTPEDCAGQLRRLLAEPDRAAELASRYRRTVLAHHTYAHRARGLRRIVTEHNERLSFCLKVGAPDAAAAERWGDTHLARGLGRALRRAGHRWRVDVLPDWDGAGGSICDVTVHLWGRSPSAPAPGQFNVLWLISHPDEFDPAAAAAFDLVCVASAPFAADLARRLEVPVRALQQATDPRVFFPERDPALAHELAFVGNSRGVRRRILEDLLPTDHDLAVWGGGWAQTPVAAHVRAEHVPNDELRRIYASAQLVLCDHWPDMRSRGFVSNRVYDALACGATVLSDAVVGLPGSFGDAVVSYEDPDELHRLVDRLLADPAERARRARAGREWVLAGATFDDRARELLGMIDELRGDGGAQRDATVASTITGA